MEKILMVDGFVSTVQATRVTKVETKVGNGVIVVVSVEVVDWGCSSAHGLSHGWGRGWVCGQDYCLSHRRG